MVYLFDKAEMIISACLYLIMVFVLWFKFKKDWVFILICSVFYLYLIEVISVTQYPIYIDDEQRTVLGPFGLKNFNFIPFKDSFSFTSILNVIMTIPFGFGLPFISKRGFTNILLKGMLFGILIETWQAAVGIYAGYTMRSIDINDVIFNTTGVAIGYLTYQLFVLIVKKACSDKTKPTRFIKYIIER